MRSKCELCHNFTVKCGFAIPALSIHRASAAPAQSHALSEFRSIAKANHAAHLNRLATSPGE